VRAFEHVDKPLETVPEQMFERVAKHIAAWKKPRPSGGVGK